MDLLYTTRGHCKQPLVIYLKKSLGEGDDVCSGRGVGDFSSGRSRKCDFVRGSLEGMRVFLMVYGLSKDGMWLSDSSKIGRVSGDVLSRSGVD